MNAAVNFHARFNGFDKADSARINGPWVGNVQANLVRSTLWTFFESPSSRGGHWSVEDFLTRVNLSDFAGPPLCVEEQHRRTPNGW
jgi:hypothetical protein